MRIFSFNMLVAFIIWWIGLWTTILFLEEIGVGSKGYMSIFVGVAVQLALTFAQHSLWNGTKNKPILIAAFLFFSFDTLLNFGGLYPYLVNITDTSAYNNLGLPSNIPDFFLITISLVICAMFAMLPEIIATNGGNRNGE